uniref:Uncharacterized protein n=1 Tax=Anopheles albimanus TaxID=7167 RepID=A0A182FX33_ANOAL
MPCHHNHCYQMSCYRCGVISSFHFSVTDCCCSCWSKRNRTPSCCASIQHPPWFPFPWLTFRLQS